LALHAEKPILLGPLELFVIHTWVEYVMTPQVFIYKLLTAVVASPRDFKEDGLNS
jgi:hypothetical protein